jgi:hypothetical protein
MQQMKETEHRVVLVRDGAGHVVHTHEVIYFGGADKLDDDQLQAQALAAARRARSREGDLVAAISSSDELTRVRNEARQRRNEARQTRHE